MSLTVNVKTYTNDTARSADSYRYLGAAHDYDTADYIDLKRQAPAVNQPTSKSRSTIKLTRTLTDGTTAVGDSIVSIDFAIPQGAATAEVQALMDDLGAWLATTAADDLVLNHKINQ